jgi:circadian clock protein KaiC
MRGERAATGVPGLDDVLGGGLPRDRLYLVQGQPGVGKTTLGLQFLMEGVRSGEPVLYITLSETRIELEEVAASHGWNLDGISLFELSSMEADVSLSLDNTVFHPAEVELEETTRSLLKMVDKVHPRRVVFDSLSEMRLLARDSLRYRRQILALKQHFAGRGCTVLLLDDTTSDPGDMHLQSIAHGVVILEQHSPGFGTDRRTLKVQKLRGVAFRSGFHDADMGTGGLRVFPRLVAMEHRHEVEERIVSSGVQSLDEILGGGLDRGASVLFLGPAGSGKSSISVLYATAAAKRGEKAVIYSFEESPRTLYKRSRALGIDLEQQIEAGRIKVQHIDPAELSPGQFAQLVQDDVRSGEISVVVIDSLNGYMNAMPEERFLLLQLHELLMFLGQKGVTSLLVVAMHGMIGSMAAPVDVSYLADTVVLFRFFEFEGRLKRAISTIKRRGGSHDEGIRELIFDSDKGQIYVGRPLDHLRGVLTGTPVPIERSSSDAAN